MRNIAPELLGKFYSRIGAVPFVAIEPALDGRYAECLAQVGTFKNPLLISDKNTYPVSGKQIAEELGLNGSQKHVLEGEVHAHIKTAEKIGGAASGHDIIIAVGSGTINDLCKYASHLSNVPCVTFATAPSMNGYVSSTSSLISENLKTSHPSNLPLGIFCDMTVIANAPYRLIRSGIGDMLCRSTVQADWLLSYLLLDTAYDEAPFELVKPYEDSIIMNAALFPERDMNSIIALMKSLLIGGFGMTMCGGSYPASQGEHIIAHALEREYAELMNKFYHGEHIAVTALYMDELQRSILDCKSHPICNRTISDDTKSENKSSESNIQKINKRLANNWWDIKSKIARIIHPAGVLKQAMNVAKLPTKPADIHLSESQFMEGVRIAPMLRNRLSFLNLSIPD